jgi:hypothetical protein
MMLTTETAPSTHEEGPMLPTPVVRKTRCNIAGTNALWSGPQANPRRIRLTAPGNPVHR